MFEGGGLKATVPVLAMHMRNDVQSYTLYGLQVLSSLLRWT